MKKQALLLVVVLAIVVIGAIFFFSGKSDSPGNDSGNDDNGLGNQDDNNQGTPTGSTYNVLIQGFAFNPETITIKVGDTIKWMNTEMAKHTITSDLGGELNSPELSKSQTYSHTFAKAGEYTYHCSFHTSMTAKIIVQ